MESIVIHPQTPRKSVNEDVKEEIKDDHNEVWHSCCLKMDKQAVMYIIQVFAIYSVIIFSCYMVMTRNSCENGVYLSLLSSSIAVFFPSPSMGKKK